MIYILDSYGLIYRSYYAFISRPLINEEGQNVSAVFGFFRNLLALLKSHNPKCLAAAFDSKTATFRHEMYKEYKATRQKTPEDLHAQIPMIENILEALGVKVLREDGFEADDVIATIAAECEKNNRKCGILSADKDLMQLVTKNTHLFKPGKTGGWDEVDENGVREEWGVLPEKMLDILSLVGDTADNIPGVAGVGGKTAVKFLDLYGSLEGIYEHADEIPGAIGNKIRDGKENAFFSRELIKLRYDVPLSIGLDDLCCTSLDYEKAAKLLYEYGVTSVAKDYAAMAGISLKSEKSEKAKKTEKVENNENLITVNTFTVKDLEEDAPLKTNHGKYTTITEENQLKDYIHGILEKGSCAFDCETDGLDTKNCRMAGFSLSYEKGTGVYIPLGTGDNLFAEPGLDINLAFNQLRRIFCNDKMTIVMHNGKFDLQVLSSHGLFKNTTNANNELKAKILDTMVACWLLESDRTSFSLENLAERKLGLATIAYKDIVPKGGTFFDVPLEKATEYASEDADLTWQLWEIFKTALEKSGLDKLFYEIEMPILLILAEMEQNGIRIEKEELNKYGIELSAQLQNIEKEIFEIVGHDFNIASPKQLQQVLFEERQLKTVKKTKTGYSTDTSVLEELADQDPVPAKILEYRGLAKLISTYVDALPVLADSDSRIHTSFVQTGTATGRLSSREPNLQNIPVRDEAGRKIRMAFSAPKGRCLVSADYSQIELVILAHLSQDKNLCHAFNSGIDVHKATAALIFGVSQDEVTPDMRRTAKTINFGVMYGMSAFRLAKDLKITRTKAQDFINQYFQTYNGVRNFIDKTVEACEENGYVETIYKRRRFISTINSKNKTEKAGAQRIAVNTPIQGSAADIVKIAMINVHKELKDKYPSAKLLLQVHDELIVECDENEKDNVASLIKETMENVIKLQVPLKVSVEKGNRWGEFH